MISFATVRLSSVVLTALSAVLSLAVMATAADVLREYNSQRSSNPWWLPIWPAHFDATGLKTVVGASVGITVLDLAIVGVDFVAIRRTRLVPVMLAGLAFVVALIEVSYPAVIDARTGTDTMQTWTCRWGDSSTFAAISNGVPPNFGKLCHESKFAYFATIPVFVLQLQVLGLLVWSTIAAGKQDKAKTSHIPDETEKDFETVVALPKYEFKIERD